MKKAVSIFILILACSFQTQAQEYVHQVIILNEGYFDYSLNQSVVPPTIGIYDPQTEVYSTLDTLSNARFASDLIVTDDFIYVAADNLLYQYDKFSSSLLQTQQVDGIRNLAVWQDKIIASRGDYDNVTYEPILFESYLQVFNSSDLTLYTQLDTINGPKWSTQNMIVENNSLYIAINNAFEFGNEKGLIGIVDLLSMTYNTEVDLGPDGKNPDNMIFDGTNIYTVNNKDWSGASISKLDLSDLTPTTINISQLSTGCGTSCLRDNKILYQISGDTDLYEWDLSLMPNSGNSMGFNQGYYEIKSDNINTHLYASSTDYFSYGLIEIYDSLNVMIGTFNCGISPGVIDFDVRNSAVGIDEYNDISTFEKSSYDLHGRKTSSIEDKPNGIYIINGIKTMHLNN
jgi:hypothetical protein